MSNTTTLEAQLSAGLIADQDVLTIEPTAVFLDLLWDKDLSFAEIRQLDPATMIDSRQSERRLVFQTVRKQLRFWGTTDRRPESDSAVSILGIVDTHLTAVALSREFLVHGVEPHELRTERSWFRVL